MSKWDFDKLFADFNVIGTKNVHENKVYPWVIDSSNASDDYNIDFEDYTNDNLARMNVTVNDYDGNSYTTDFLIQYIIQLDSNGNVINRLFDRDRDMPNPMPELKDGMFGKALWFEDGYFHPDAFEFGDFVVSNNNLIYQVGGYDKLPNPKKEIDEWGDVIVVEIYDSYINSFNHENIEEHILWRNPMYQEWLDENTEEED